MFWCGLFQSLFTLMAAKGRPTDYLNYYLEECLLPFTPFTRIFDLLLCMPMHVRVLLQMLHTILIKLILTERIGHSEAPNMDPIKSGILLSLIHI